MISGYEYDRLTALDGPSEIPVVGSVVSFIREGETCSVTVTCREGGASLKRPDRGVLLLLVFAGLMRATRLLSHSYGLSTCDRVIGALGTFVGVPMFYYLVDSILYRALRISDGRSGVAEDSSASQSEVALGSTQTGDVMNHTLPATPIPGILELILWLFTVWATVKGFPVVFFLSMGMAILGRTVRLRSHRRPQHDRSQDGHDSVAYVVKHPAPYWALGVTALGAGVVASSVLPMSIDLVHRFAFERLGGSVLLAFGLGVALVIGQSTKKPLYDWVPWCAVSNFVMGVVTILYR